MSLLDSFAASWLRSMANASLLGACFILAVWLLCLAFRRLPAWVRGWLWWIACAQMLVRLFLTVPVPVPVAVPEARVASTANVGPPPPVAAASSTPVEAPAAASQPATFAESAPTELTPGSILFGIWSVGVVLGVGVSVRRLWAARRLIRSARPLGEPTLGEVLDSLLRKAERRPKLLESNRIKGALLAGYVRPAIVLPEGFFESYDIDEVQMTLAHEVAHLRRRDHWTSLVLAAASIAFFFHPLVWLAVREANLAREEACDQEALRLSGASPTAYARFLLKSAQARTPVAALGAAYGYRNLRRRITMLKNTNSVNVLTNGKVWLPLIVAGLTAALPWSVVAQPVQKPSKPTVTKPAAKAVQTTATRAVKASAPAAKPKRSAAPKPAPVESKTIAVSQPVRAEQPAAAAISAVAPPVTTDAKAAIAEPTDRPPVEGTRTVAAVGREAGVGTTAPVVKMDQSGRLVNTASDIHVEQNSAVEPLERLATARLIRADLEDSLASLLSQSGSDFVIRAKIYPESITCGLNRKPTLEAVGCLLKASSQPLTYRVEGTVIYIVPLDEKE